MGIVIITFQRGDACVRDVSGLLRIKLKVFAQVFVSVDW